MVLLRPEPSGINPKPQTLSYRTEDWCALARSVDRVTSHPYDLPSNPFAKLFATYFVQNCHILIVVESNTLPVARKRP